MWTPHSYRVDDVWGRKRRSGFFRLEWKTGTRPLELNLYHLKMIEPTSRAEHVRVHTPVNTRDSRACGFDYMTDERGLRLEQMPQGRGFSPPYRPYSFDVQGNG